jgi:hypothetical protein
MSKSKLALAAVMVSGLVWALPSQAADLTPAGPTAAGPAACGPCGCLRVAYDHHRELRTTYGTGFDPRNYDFTEPHYYFGAMRPYPRYYVEGATGPGPIPGQCSGYN